MTHLHRRHVIGAALASLSLRPHALWAAETDLAALERKTGGRLGVFAMVPDEGELLSRRADETFGMCSTFKAFLAGMLLDDVMRQNLDASRNFDISGLTLLPHSPVIERYREAGADSMTLLTLIEAIVTISDNTAANVLLRLIGGPRAFTDRARDIVGSDAIRLDRYEIELNRTTPEDPRDKASPRAMAEGLSALLYGGAIHPQAGLMLKAMMADSLTGRSRLRAGFPAGAFVGDKTGISGQGLFGDIAFIEREDGRRAVVACYVDAAGLSGKDAAAVHREVGRLTNAALGAA
ncbi:MAG: class A beta-lactamase [Parvularcula sp.]|nr:class A beta-lactamase [Parvularcula sp.]